MNNKILVAYFMHKGHSTSNSKRIAEDLAAGLSKNNFDCVEYAITPVEEFPKDNTLFEGVVKLEQKNHYRPTLTGKAGKFHDYDTIVVVAPNWFGDVPMGVYSFFDEYDFGNKTVYPVICHGGDGGKEIREYIRRYLPMADVLDGIDIPDSSDDATLIKEAVDAIVNK